MFDLPGSSSNQADSDLGEAHLIMLAGRAVATQRAPYLSRGFYALRLVALDEIVTMAVSEDWTLYYAPKFVLSLSVVHCAGVWTHELSHLLRRHGERARKYGDIDPLLWNIAGDLAINGDLKLQGYELPDYGVFPNAMGFAPHLSVEKYYQLLNGLSKKARRALLGISSWQCGSGCDGIYRRYQGSFEASKETELKQPNTLPVYGLGDNSKNQDQSVLRAIARDVIRRAPSEKIPSLWLDWSKKTLGIQVDWRRHLYSSVRRSLYRGGVFDYSYMRLSRRECDDLIMPAMVDRYYLGCAVVVDTSGSMDSNTLTLIISELAALSSELKGEALWVIQCDNEVRAISKWRRGQDITVMGGGGTDMRVGMQAALDLGVPLGLIVILTDGATPWPPERPASSFDVKYLAVTTDPLSVVPLWLERVDITMSNASGDNLLP